MRTLLICMPFGALDRQALGLSLLKAGLTARGFPCDVRYLTFPFAETVGWDEYRWLTTELPHTAFVGEWCFAGALYGDDPGDDPARAQDYVEEVLRRTWELPEATIARILRIRRLAAPFIAHCLATVPWGDYDVVGFTSTFEQNLPSLALARGIKAAAPATTIVFGGANWEGEMGTALHALFPFVDYVCSGEADESFPALLARLRDGAPVADLSGIVYRDASGSVSTGPPALVTRMDELPFADFSDYFRDLGDSTIAAHVVPNLLFETSRGCWWGARSHCTFCGLNGGSMAFRSKSPARALAELDHLVRSWGFEMIEVVDNILDLSYFESVLPALVGDRRSLRLFYEVKANLTRAQVRLLAAAGVTRIQPGIESLSDRVLKHMRKGTTALRNVQLLKWCREYGVRADWNLLYGFPGETREDYAGAMAVMEAIRFLDPPGACGPLRLDRFSPYFDRPGDFGLTNLRPVAPYAHLYPEAGAALAKIAYYFDFDYAPNVHPQGCAGEAVAVADAWRRQPDPGVLQAWPEADGTLVLIDTREDALVGEVRLADLERAAYELCDAVQTIGAVTRHLHACFPERRFDDAAVVAFLDSLVANRLMLSDGAHYLSLALRGAEPAAIDRARTAIRARSSDEVAHAGA